jgi:hypothetical protein
MSAGGTEQYVSAPMSAIRRIELATTTKFRRRRTNSARAIRNVSDD